MEYKGQSLSGRDIATVELLEEIKAYFSEDGAAKNALALGGVNATSYALKADVDKNIADLENSATKVSFAQTLTGGTKIGSITIDGTTSNIYAPSLTGYATQKWVNQQGFAKSADVEAVEAMFDSYYTSKEIDDKISNFNSSFLSIEGGQIYGDLRLKPREGYYGCYLYFGDESYSYIAEQSDDKMTIYSSKGVSIETSTGYSVDIGATLNANGTLNALQGVVIPTGKTLKIGDATLSWDSTNNALKVDKPMYSTGTIASGGVAAAASQLTTLEARVKALEDNVNELI